MTDESLQNSVGNLGNSVGDLLRAVESQAAGAAALAVQVEESNQRSARDARILKILTGVMVFKMVTLALLGFVLLRLNETNQTIKSCTTPAGECAQRNAQATSQFLVSMALRSERERLATELPIAEEKADSIRVEMLRQRLTELNTAIGQIDKTLAEIQQQRANASANN